MIISEKQVLTRWANKVEKASFLAFSIGIIVNITCF